METLKMKEIPDQDRPYEKCLHMGPEVLSDAELLSVIIRTGSRGENSLELSRRLLDLNHSGEGILGLLHVTLPELMKIKGIGMVKGIQLMCIGELSKRIWKTNAVRKVSCFQEPEEIARYYREDLRHMEYEQVRVMLLNNKNMLIKDIMISQGTVNTSIATPREIFIAALRYRAVCLVMVHNHPSGDPSPSQADLNLTRRIKEAGSIIGIQLLDHIIIGDHTYISFRKEGIL